MQSSDLVISERDNNKYQFIQLENGLQALLIQDIPDLAKDPQEPEDQAQEGDDDGSDEDQKQSEEDQEDEEEDGSRLAAVALSVTAGCFHEQRECNGIAHFLEHMCFMGSDTYPNENEFDNLLNKYGGYSNAFTDVMNTNYQFAVSAKHLKKVLDIFAHFFIDPLLKPDAVNREIEAIQNEYQTSLTSQAHRFHEIFMYFVQTPEVRGRFLMGSSESILGPRPTPQAKAEECEGFQQGMEHLRAYFKRNYDPRAMRLVVSSSAPLEELKTLVTESFSSIPFREIPKFDWKSQIPFITPQSAQQVVLFESTKTNIILYIGWGFPCSGVEYRNKSTQYLANLIGHQAKGSLLHLLKSQKYASSLSAYTEDSINVISHLFHVEMKLTELGLENLNEVITLIFSYITWLQSLPSLPVHLFEEEKQMKDIKFKFLEKQDPFDQVTDLAQQWTFLEKEDRHLLLREKENCYTTLNLEEIKNYLNQIKFQTTKILLSVPKLFQKGKAILERDPDRKTTLHPFYKVNVVEANRQKVLLKPVELKPAKVVAFGASLPTPNPYIPTDFETVKEEYSKLEEKAPKNVDLTPQLLHETEGLRLFYSLDKTFQMPTSVYSFVITLDEPRSTVRDNALLYLWVKLLEQSFNIEHGYYGSLAKAEYEIELINDRQITFRVEGYMHNLEKLVLDFFKSMSKLLKGSKEDIDLDLYEVERQQFIKKQKNQLMSGTYLAQKVKTNLNQNDTHWNQVLRKEAQSTSSQDLLNYVTERLSNCAIYVTAFYYGCLGPQPVKQQLQVFLSPLESFSRIEKQRMTQLKQQMGGLLPGSPDAIKDISVTNRNPDSELSTCIVSCTLPYQFPGNFISQRLTLSLLNHLMSERCFNELRTKQALGYTVYSSRWSTRKVMGIKILVQSAKQDPDYLEARIKEFIAQFIEDLEKKKEEMKEDMQGLIEELETPFNKVTELTQSVWGQILQQTAHYNKKRDMLKLLKSLDYEEFAQTAKKVLLKPGEEGKLNAQVIKVWAKPKAKPDVEQTPIETQLTEIKTKYVLIG